MTPAEIERLALERGGTVTPVNLGYLPKPPRTDEDRLLDEKAFDAEIVKLAKRNGWETYHTYNSRKSSEGWPDRAFWRERFLLAELKTEDGKLSKEQSETITSLRNAGVEVYVWRPSQWAEIEKVLGLFANT